VGQGSTHAPLCAGDPDLLHPWTPLSFKIPADWPDRFCLDYNKLRPVRQGVPSKNRKNAAKTKFEKISNPT
jgi:hypothetical protein